MEVIDGGRFAGGGEEGIDANHEDGGEEGEGEVQQGEGTDE